MQQARLELLRTPLYDIHKSLGARFVDFAGWEMPVYYKRDNGGIVKEHLAVRASCGIFDVSHMGEIEISGPEAFGLVQRLTTNDAGKLEKTSCQYTLLCNPNGTVIDDVILYRRGIESYLFCTNAINTEKVFQWIRSEAPPSVEVTDVSDTLSQIALQGPSSVELISPLVDIEVCAMKPFHFSAATVCGQQGHISRTGYTGEDGFEIFVAPWDAHKVWAGIMERGSKYGIAAVGLGARDTLRLEMGYPLYGRELDETITPLEAGLSRFVSFDKGEFMGKAALEEQKKAGMEKKLIAFVMNQGGIPRPHCPITHESQVIGEVTSGSYSPSLEIGMGMGFVKPAFSTVGSAIGIEIRKRGAAATLAARPVYTGAEKRDVV